MYDPIVLALDGSAEAERCIPHAEAMAHRFGGRIVVLRAVPPPALPGEAPDPTLQHLEQRAAEAYVRGRAAELRSRGLRAEGVYLTGDPASVIVDYAAAQQAGLVVIATHGRGGMARWVFGSVAERVLRAATVPVLLVRVAAAGADRR